MNSECTVIMPGIYDFDPLKMNLLNLMYKYPEEEK